MNKIHELIAELEEARGRGLQDLVIVDDDDHELELIDIGPHENRLLLTVRPDRPSR